MDRLKTTSLSGLTPSSLIMHWEVRQLAGSTNERKRESQRSRLVEQLIHQIHLLNSCETAADREPAIKENRTRHVPKPGCFVLLASKQRGPDAPGSSGPAAILVAAATARASAAWSAATAFARLIAIPAKHRPVATRLKRHCCRLSATRANHRCSLCWSRTVAGAPLIVFLCHTASFATLRGRVTAFLKERLISSGEGEVLPAIAARKLNISGHGSPRGDCTEQTLICTQGFFLISKTCSAFRRSLGSGKLV